MEGQLHNAYNGDKLASLQHKELMRIDWKNRRIPEQKWAKDTRTIHNRANVNEVKKNNK